MKSRTDYLVFNVPSRVGFLTITSQVKEAVEKRGVEEGLAMANAKKIPPTLVPLIPMAEKWGIGDDGEREHALQLASAEELSAIVHCIDDVSEEFYGWLEGPEARSPRPSPEYLALSCLALAIDSAVVRLKKLQKL